MASKGRDGNGGKGGRGDQDKDNDVHSISKINNFVFHSFGAYERFSTDKRQMTLCAQGHKED